MCDWLNQVGFGDCIEEFKENHIEGDSLLTLTNSDLKELNVAALGDRKILQREIEFLRLIFKSQCIGDPISKFYHREVTLKLVRELEKKKSHNQSKMERLASRTSSSSSSSSSDEREEIKRKKSKNGKKKTMQCKQDHKFRESFQLHGQTRHQVDFSHP